MRRRARFDLPVQAMVKIRALAGLRVRPLLPRPAIRVRMALSYWGLFVASGAILLVVTVALWQGETTTVNVPGPGTENPSPGHPGPARPAGVTTTHGSDLGQLLVVADIALAIMAVVSIMFAPGMTGILSQLSPPSARTPRPAWQ